MGNISSNNVFDNCLTYFKPNSYLKIKRDAKNNSKDQNRDFLFQISLKF